MEKQRSIVRGRPRTSEAIRVQPDGFGGLFRGLLKKPKSKAPKVIEYLGKMAVRTTSLGPKMAVGSSPTSATKCDQLMLTDVNSPS
jgi:hypothetical protein